ncbi:DHHC palmitoyltransferase domain-containing protein [Ditylenchus destructor]|nr:DHHC palmitoyltransferase domain-containing protein [Ditylenchus destructor]
MHKLCPTCPEKIGESSTGGTMTSLSQTKPDPPSRRRINGWQCPWDVMQVLSWVTIPLMCGVSILITLPLPHYPIVPILIGSFYGWNVLLVLILTSIDPSPPSTRHIRPATFERNEHHQHVIEKGYCNVCKMNAFEGTKHCRQCNKCIPGYDHHCKWLNTCVGQRNYRCFVTLVVSLTLMSFLLFVILFIAILFYIVRAVQGHTEPFRYDGGVIILDSVSWTVASLICILCYATVFGFTAHLLNFHFMLLRTGLTTISYIQQKRQTQIANAGKNMVQRSIPTISANVPTV